MFEKSVAEEAPAIQMTGGSDGLAKRLDEDLIRTRTQLRTTTERYEVQTEEMHASNEELQAINEELRSYAEELETSKEELQSVNEELTTVNQELKIKIEELSQTNNDFSNLMSATSIGTLFLDRNYCVKLFTPAARQIFNLIPADYGRPLSDITHRLTETDVIAEAGQAIQHLQLVEREVHTAEEQTFLMRISPYRTAEDRINGIVITFLDITERKKSEEAMRRSAERDAYRITLSDALRPLTDPVQIQAVSARVLGGHLGASHVHYGEVEADNEHLVVLQDYTAGVVSLTGRFRMADFSPEVTAQLRTGRKIIVADIAASAGIPEEIRAANAGIVGIASHKLRTPVTSIKAYAEVLQEMFEEAGETQSVGLMQKMDAQVDRLTELIRALLDVTRLSEGKLEIRIETFSMNALIAEIIEDMQRTAGQQLEFNPGPVSDINGDRERIGQVITNLVYNAIKYSPGTDRIILTTALTDSHEVKVCVQDFGIGMSMASQAQVFNRFYRSEGAGISTYPGLGLGLYISSEIVQ